MDLEVQARSNAILLVTLDIFVDPLGTYRGGDDDDTDPDVKKLRAGLTSTF